MQRALPILASARGRARLWLAHAVTAIAWLVVPAQAQAPLDVRIALVIGNSAYPDAPLVNPANDASAMGDVLRGMGFVVVQLRDATQAKMQSAIARMGRELAGKHGVGMLYYAGHGLQLDWRNYMLPVDGRFAVASDVPAHAVDVQSVLDAFRAAGNRMNIVVLDACRDNPYGASASAKGLAPMDAPSGTFLAYATAPGNVAEDGSAATGNGLYTQYLVQELKVTATRIEDVFKRVRLQVRRSSQGRQIPWESTSLEEDFYFDSGRKVAAVPDKVREAEFQSEKAAWERIKDSRNAEDFYAYLQRFPNGTISEKAQFQLEQLQKSALAAQPGIDGVASVDSSGVRYRAGDRLVYRTFDGYNKEQGLRELLITEASDARVVVNGGQEVWDPMGNLVTNGEGTREPAKILFPADLVLNKRWQSAYTLRSPLGAASIFWDFKVVALERITVPAGTFQAYRVEGSSRTSNGAFQSQTVWIDPVSFVLVRNDFVMRVSSAIRNAYRHELVAVERASAPK